MSNQVEGEQYKGDSKIDVSKPSICESYLSEHVRGKQKTDWCQPCHSLQGMANRIAIIGKPERSERV
jgi:hypothetical protein